MSPLPLEVWTCAATWQSAAARRLSMRHGGCPPWENGPLANRPASPMSSSLEENRRPDCSSSPPCDWSRGLLLAVWRALFGFQAPPPRPVEGGTDATLVSVGLPFSRLLFASESLLVQAGHLSSHARVIILLDHPWGSQRPSNGGKVHCQRVYHPGCHDTPSPANGGWVPPPIGAGLE